jgi:trigger factor
MQSQISEISSVMVQVSVEVPWADVERAMEGSYSELGRTAKVKGFRPGKVPRTVLKQLFGPRVKRDVVNNLIEAGLGKAVEQHQLTVVSVPPMETVPEFKQGEPLAFTAKLEVRPKIDQVDIDGLSLVRESVAVTDAQVDEAIERLRQQNGELKAPEPARASQDGDVLTCDYRVSIEGSDRPDLAATARPIDLAGGLLPELKTALTGKSVGDKASADVTFPADQGGEFAGKVGTFNLEIKEIKEKVLPALDDEFAKDLEHASLDELKQKTRARLEDTAKQNADSALREQVVDKVLEKNPIDVPPSLVAQQQQAMLQEYVRMIRMTGQRMDLGDDLMTTTKENAERRVRAALLLGAIARLNGIKVEGADLDKRLGEMAEKSGKHVAKLRAEMQGEQREVLESQILEEKLLEYLLGRATITESAT